MDSIEDEMMAVFKEAQKKFELYEKFYLGFSEKAKEYLKHKSREYKKILSDIQEIILPAIKGNCSRCTDCCCRLHTKEITIYGSVGCFDHVDYLLVRCDTILPDPCYENAEKNLCPFWSDGCILPTDCRSYMCIQYFCDTLEKELDMQVVSKYLRKAALILTNFSTEECMS